MMLLEFLVIHSAGFMGAATLSASIAFGFLYFLVVGIGEMLLVRRLAIVEKGRRQ
ncbi:MAG TPA: hypothetical protein VFU23_06590 [Gemmatimonadales bacterium]|nr:hypothetical protein [Gemmatimonadales bacterium]